MNFVDSLLILIVDVKLVNDGEAGERGLTPLAKDLNHQPVIKCHVTSLCWKRFGQRAEMSPFIM